MKFRVPGLLGGHVYSTWEEAYNNCPDGRESTIMVEMTSKEYVDLHNSYNEKINLLTGQNNRLREMLKENNLDHQKEINKKITELNEKDRRCASLAAAVNRLKSKRRQKGGII